MQRERLPANVGGLLVEADGLRLVLHSDGSADLETPAGAAQLEPAEVWALASALRAPGVAGLLSRAAVKRARAGYDEQRRETA